MPCRSLPPHHLHMLMQSFTRKPKISRVKETQPSTTAISLSIITTTSNQQLNISNHAPRNCPAYGKIYHNCHVKSFSSVITCDYHKPKGNYQSSISNDIFQQLFAIYIQLILLLYQHLRNVTGFRKFISIIVPLLSSQIQVSK